jgi:hypothetical protein
MASWPIDAEGCRNCTGSPDRYAHGASGYCNRCYRLLRQIERVKRWDRAYPDTLKGIPKSGIVDFETGPTARLLTDNYDNDEFEIVRQEYIRQYRARLKLLCHREQVRRHEFAVSALQLEEKFGQFLRLIRPRASYPRNASYINDNFNEAERRVIYGLLEEILEQAPWNGVQWFYVVRKISQYQNEGKKTSSE